MVPKMTDLIHHNGLALFSDRRLHFHDSQLNSVEFDYKMKNIILSVNLLCTIDNELKYALFIMRFNHVHEIGIDFFGGPLVIIDSFEFFKSQLKRAVQYVHAEREYKFCLNLIAGGIEFYATDDFEFRQQEPFKDASHFDSI